MKQIVRDAKMKSLGIAIFAVGLIFMMPTQGAYAGKSAFDQGYDDEGEARLNGGIQSSVLRPE